MIFLMFKGNRAENSPLLSAFPLPWLFNGSMVHTKGELITNICSRTNSQLLDKDFVST